MCTTYSKFVKLLQGQVLSVNFTIFWWVFVIWPTFEAVPWGGGASTPPKLHERTAHARARGDFAEYSVAAAAAASMCAAAAVRYAYGW